MKIEKFKVLLFLKKTEPDKSGKAPIMGRITLNRTVAQFSTKLACTPKLWNVRENRLEGKSREAVETNAKIEKLLLAIHAAFNELQERKHDFAAADVRNLFQGSMETQMTLLRLFDRHIEETRERIGIDVCASSMSTYHYARKTLGEFVRKKYKVKDIAFGALNEQFIREYQSYPSFAKARKRIETLFSQLCDQFMLIRNYAKDTDGLFARIIGKISALTILQYINYKNNKPIGRVKYALT